MLRLTGRAIARPISIAGWPGRSHGGRHPGRPGRRDEPLRATAPNCCRQELRDLGLRRVERLEWHHGIRGRVGLRAHRGEQHERARPRRLHSRLPNASAPDPVRASSRWQTQSSPCERRATIRTHVSSPNALNRRETFRTSMVAAARGMEAYVCPHDRVGARGRPRTGAGPERRGGSDGAEGQVLPGARTGMTPRASRLGRPARCGEPVFCRDSVPRYGH